MQDSKTKFTDQLIALAESEIDREPALLSRERGKAATLIEGAVDRGRHAAIGHDEKIHAGGLQTAELDAVSGGIKGALEGVCRKDEGVSGGQSGQQDLAQLFQRVLQSVTGPA